MNKGILPIVFTFVTVYKTVDSNLKAFCVNNVYFFDSSYCKTSNFNYSSKSKINKFTCAKGCLLGTEYTTHGRWQIFQQLGGHDT